MTCECKGSSTLCAVKYGKRMTKKRGPDVVIAAKDFKLLTKAYKSFVRIKQINAQTAVNTFSHLA